MSIISKYPSSIGKALDSKTAFWPKKTSKFGVMNTPAVPNIAIQIPLWRIARYQLPIPISAKKTNPIAGGIMFVIANIENIVA